MTKQKKKEINDQKKSPECPEHCEARSLMSDDTEEFFLSEGILVEPSEPLNENG